MAGIARRCKRRPNGGVGGCTGGGAGTPPVVYPGTPTYPIKGPNGTQMRNWRGPTVRISGTVIDIPINIPVQPFTGPAPVKVGITRPVMDAGPQYIDGQQVYGLPSSALTLDVALTPSDPASSSDNLVVTISGSNAPIRSTDLVSIDITGDVLQSAVDSSFVPALALEDADVINQSTQT